MAVELNARQRRTLKLQRLLFWVCGTAVTACGSSGEPASANTGASPGAASSTATSNGNAVPSASAPSMPSQGGLPTAATPSTAMTSVTTPSAAASTAEQPGTSATAPTTAPSTATPQEPSAPPPTGSNTPPASGNCAATPWPESDPAAAGPFAVTTENEVGPEAGVDDEGNPTKFTLFRPSELDTSDRCHPVVTWGNGTGSNPSLYKALLGNLASHGFVVIASNNPNVGQGDPPPMLVGVTWVLEQNEDPASALYQRIDTSHIGATGHSQGGFATTTAAGDERITAIAPLCGASPQRNLHGPALLLCGGKDTLVTCDSIQRSFDGISTQPAMLASHLTADHGNWVTFRGTTLSPMETAVTAWMRVHLMGDTSLRSWFYGADCKLCSDAEWAVQQKALE